jgi:glycosyltransferase involved in cell wall biosynthesis
MGGLERVTTVIGESLRATHEVLFYSIFSDENFYEIKDGFFVGGTRSSLLNSRWLKLTRYQKAWEYFWYQEITIFRYIKKELSELIAWINTNNIDVVIISSPIIIACIDQLREYTSAKFIAWVHNNYHTYMTNYTRKYTSSFISGFEKADRVVCLTFPDCSKYKRINPNTSCIYNPLTINNSQISSLSNKNIAFTGRLSFEHKGIDYLIKVAKELPKDWTITIAGQGTKKELKLLRTAIQSHHIEDRLIFKGPLKDEQLIDHYLQSSMYLMTSRWEGMPLVLAEAMSFGLPIIAFEQSGSNEVLAEGKYGELIPLGNIKMMVERIDSFSKNPYLLREYQQKSLTRLEDFNLDIITNQWRTLLEELV